LGERWILTDLRVYDWWELAYSWSFGGDGKGDGIIGKWVQELMDEEGIRALPRGVGNYDKALDSRDFWKNFQLQPRRRLEL